MTRQSCMLCQQHQVYCEQCHASQQQDLAYNHYADYYSSYYSLYYARYYGGVYADQFARVNMLHDAGAVQPADATIAFRRGDMSI